MKIYNFDKTQELSESELDLSLGYLKPDKLAKRHEAMPFMAGISAEEKARQMIEDGLPIKEIRGKYYLVKKRYEGGGEEVEEIQAEPDTPAKEAWDEYEDIQVYIPYTEEELKERADAKKHAELKAELAKIKEDIEQETFGIIRDDFAEKKVRAAEIVNELRVLEGKEPRKIQGGDIDV